MIAYLKINSLLEKIISLIESRNRWLYIDKTKLDTSFPNDQFKIEGYQFPPFRIDRNSKRRGKANEKL